jgi:hypothetical protein
LASFYVYMYGNGQIYTNYYIYFVLPDLEPLVIC